MNLEERVLIYIFMIEMISFADRGKKFSSGVFLPFGVFLFKCQCAMLQDGCL